MTGLYVLSAISAALSVAAIITIIVTAKKGGQRDGVNLKDLRDENQKLKEDINMSLNNVVNTSNQMNASMVTGSVNALSSSVNAQKESFDHFITDTQASLERLRSDVAKAIAELKDSTLKSLDAIKNDTNVAISSLKESNAKSLDAVRNDTNNAINNLKESNVRSLEEVRKNNDLQLEKMRDTVDEKLSSTLDKRFNQSFQLVNTRLEEINRSFQELQKLQTDVKDLNKVFSNIKTRGTWGEVELDTLLTQILIPEQYEKQYKMERGDVVDFAIKMPGKNGDGVMLPIDAKFPIESYKKLVEALDNGNLDDIATARKELVNRIKDEAKSISEKYIKPPKTTNFAVMYLPTESLYAEALQQFGFIEDLQNKFRIVVCGPTTIAALLNSLQMGFKSLAVEKRSTEIAKLLQQFEHDFGKFLGLIDKASKNIDLVQKNLDETKKRSELIQKRLRKVGKFGDESALTDGDTLLLDAAADVDDGE